MAEELLGKSLQESLVTALLFKTDDNTKVIANLAQADWFEDPYREIVSRCLEYWKRFEKAPEGVHVDDHFDYVLANPSHKQHQLFNRILRDMNTIQETINTAYIRGRLFEFARRQKLRQTVHDAGQILLHNDTPEGYDEVEHLLGKVTNFQAEHYDLGFRFNNTTRSLAFFDRNESTELKIGIKELDEQGINPRKKEVFLFIAKAKSGKSMFLHQVGKAAIANGWRALHITLENSDTSTAQRYVQSEFLLAKRKNNPQISTFEKDIYGKIKTLIHSENPARPFYPNGEDPEITTTNLRLEIGEQLTDEWNYKYNNLWIKGFSTGELSFEKYETYLDQLALIEHFIPDIIILDYPYLMEFDRKDTRLAYGRLAQRLRGSCNRRNYALVVASQTNEQGKVAEDRSQVHTCDYAITYAQTQEEYNLGLARLFVTAARNERGNFTVLISQNYHASQFCVDSAKMVNKQAYDHILENERPEPVVVETEDC